MSDTQCAAVFVDAVVYFLSATDASEVNITVGTALDALDAKQMSLEYTVPFHFVGPHDQFLNIARVENKYFVSSVADGNFTSVLHRKSVDANVSLLFNVSSTSITMLDLDHSYNSRVPTMGPTSLTSPQDEEFYEKQWFTRVVGVAAVCGITGLLFCFGYHWMGWGAEVQGQVRHLHKVYVAPKPDDVYVESSSDSEPDSE